MCIYSIYIFFNYTITKKQGKKSNGAQKVGMVCTSRLYLVIHLLEPSQEALYLQSHVHEAKKLASSAMSSGLQLDWSKFFNHSKNGPFELVDTNVVKKLCPILRSRKLHFKSNTCILKKGEQKDKKCELLNKIVNAHQYPHAYS